MFCSCNSLIASWARSCEAGSGPTYTNCACVFERRCATAGEEFRGDIGKATCPARIIPVMTVKYVIVISSLSRRHTSDMRRTGCSKDRYHRSTGSCRELGENMVACPVDRAHALRPEDRSRVPLVIRVHEKRMVRRMLDVPVKHLRHGERSIQRGRPESHSIQSLRAR